MSDEVEIKDEEMTAEQLQDQGREDEARYGLNV